MIWYDYIAGFFAGAFLANTVPHFVQGISGNKFPTPFSKPRGIGPSSPLTNMIWSLINLLVGYLLLTISKEMYSVFAGIAVLGIWMSIHFQSRHKE